MLIFRLLCWEFYKPLCYILANCNRLHKYGQIKFIMMKLEKLRNKQFRDKHLSRITKRLKRLAIKPVESTPVFLFGKQRSGTTMLMNCLELHPDTEVFDEAEDNKAFLDYRIRNYEILNILTTRSKAPFVCFKPIADSHLIMEFIEQFPSGKFIWAYRDYKDVANSSLRKFNHASRAIKLVCLNQEGGGWFQEGVSSETALILREVYSPNLSEFDMVCLAWFARNRIFVEKNLGPSDVMLIKYEDMVSNPERTFANLSNFTGMRYDKNSIRYVHNASIAKNPYPELNLLVKKMCDDLMAALNNVAKKQL